MTDGSSVAEGESLQPNQPGVAHVEVGSVEMLVGSLQPPKKPGEKQVVLEVCVIVPEDLVAVVVVMVLSLQPNQPGVLQVLVLVVVVSLVVVVAVPLSVVDSSRQPHHPGVLQVSVRVIVLEVELLSDVVVSELLLS